MPEVPGRGGEAMARRARGRPAAGALLSHSVHAAGADQRHSLPEQGGALRHPVQGVGVGRDLAAQTGGGPHGTWRLSNIPALNLSLPNAGLAALGLPSLVTTNPIKLANRRVRT